MRDDRVRLFGSLDGWRIQMRLWGYALQGNLLEPTAIISEDRNVEAIVPGAWDRTAADLLAELICNGGSLEHVPEWWALPAVADLLLPLSKSMAPVSDTSTYLPPMRTVPGTLGGNHG